MRLTRLYKDDNSSITGCPSVYETDGPDLIVQGPQVAEGIQSWAAGEAAVRISRDTLTAALHRLEHPETSRNVEPFSPEWYALFEGRRSIYRLELLQSYTDPGEAGALRRFQAGELPDPADAGWWARLVNDARVRGGTVQRVHVVAEPMTDYLKFEMAVYSFSVAYGEDIRILPADVAAGMDLPGHDYWLFDSRTLLILRYDLAGRLDTAELVGDPAAIMRHGHWRDVALAKSMPFGRYLAAHPARKEELATDHVPT